MSDALRKTLGGVQSPAMKGDNLAILLASFFEDATDAHDENGWSETTIAQSDEVFDAIHAHYASEIARLRTELEAAKGDADLREELACTLEELIDHNGDSLDDARANRVRELRSPRSTITSAPDARGHKTLREALHDLLTRPTDPSARQRARSALTADKSEAEVRQQEQIREDERDRLYVEALCYTPGIEAAKFLKRIEGAMLPEERARSRAQGGMDKGVGE